MIAESVLLSRTIDRSELASASHLACVARARASLLVGLARLALAEVASTRPVRFLVTAGTGSMRGSVRIRVRPDVVDYATFAAVVGALESAGFMPIGDGWAPMLAFARRLGRDYLRFDLSVVITDAPVT